MIYLTDCTYYRGDVCKGLIHGMGTLFVSLSPLLYHGNWKAGKKDGHKCFIPNFFTFNIRNNVGRGWLLYDNSNWYDGDWQNDRYHGWGYRQYNLRERYKGNWSGGYRNGLGTMVYGNGDVNIR